MEPSIILASIGGAVIWGLIKVVLQAIFGNRKRLKPVPYVGHMQYCRDHMQEPNQSHYADHNCDHCKALAKFESERG